MAVPVEPHVVHPIATRKACGGDPEQRQRERFQVGQSPGRMQGMSVDNYDRSNVRYTIRDWLYRRTLQHSVTGDSTL
jgi:hypothetical protein